MGSLYSVGYSGSSGYSGITGISGIDGTTLYSHSDFRLTLESGVAISSTNQEARTTLYMTPYIGKQICLYYGGSWGFYDTEEVSISLSGKTAGKNFDVFAYYSGSAVALELLEWTNDLNRPAALTRTDGVYVKNSDPTRKYMGTIRTTGTTGQSEDSFTSRYVWNMYNKVQRWGFTTNTTSYWSYTTPYNTWQELNNGTNHIKFKFVIGMPQSFHVQLHGESINNTNSVYTGYCIDATTTSYGYHCVSASKLAVGRAASTTNVNLWPAGYHYVTAVEDNTAGTMTNYGAGSTLTPGYNHTILLEG